jgi:hypothetical protein
MLDHGGRGFHAALESRSPQCPGSGKPQLLSPDLGGNSVDLGREELGRLSLPKPRDLDRSDVLTHKVDQPFSLRSIFPQTDVGYPRDAEGRAQPVLASLGKADEPDGFVRWLRLSSGRYHLREVVIEGRGLPRAGHEDDAVRAAAKAGICSSGLRRCVCWRWTGLVLP